MGSNGGELCRRELRRIESQWKERTLSVDDVNLVKNPRFERRAGIPRHWKWEVLRGEASWSYEAGRSGNGDWSICVQCDSAESSGRVYQRVGCCGEQHYRIEAIVRCEAAADSI